MEIICIYLGMGVWGLGEPSCDSATGVPKYGNPLHIHQCLCIGMGYGA